MSVPRRLLVVDDDPAARDWLGAFADRLGYEVELASTGEAALEAFRSRPSDLVTLDVLLPGMNGLDTLKALRDLDGGVPIIMLSGHGQTRTIVDAVRQGATDFLRKPFEPEELELAFEKALARKRALMRDEATSDALLSIEGRDIDAPEKARLRKRSAAKDALVFKGGEKMRAVLSVVERVADTDITVLIRGESGTGKELVAQAIHARSNRCSAPLVKVNCAALPSELLESELFGYEKGAFTGAQRRKLGKFELANCGTIFLDEISEMHPNLQAKLLQVLQDGQFSRLGGEFDLQVDTRIIAATNRDLEASVRDGSFREDLFYRLNVVTIRIPPLRERPDEIAGLTDHFLCLYAKEYGKEHKLASDELRVTFAAYRWPGNVRELENLVKRMVVLGSEAPVLQELAARSAKLPTRGPSTGSSAVSELERFLKGDLERVSLKKIGREAAQAAERRLIERVLQLTRWNRREAAEILQISYKALLYKMKDAGLADRA
jgi:two-component system response regulator AtoC